MNSRSPGFNDRKASSLWWGLLVVAGLIVFIALVASARRASAVAKSPTPEVTIVWESTGRGATRGRITNNTDRPLGPLIVDAAYDQPIESKGFDLGTTEMYCDPYTVRCRPLHKGEGPSNYLEPGESATACVWLNYNLVKSVRVREGFLNSRAVSVESIVNLG